MCCCVLVQLSMAGCIGLFRASHVDSPRCLLLDNYNGQRFAMYLGRVWMRGMELPKVSSLSWLQQACDIFIYIYGSTIAINDLLSSRTRPRTKSIIDDRLLQRLYLFLDIGRRLCHLLMLFFEGVLSTFD